MSSSDADADSPSINIREMGIDDFAPIFHLGEEIFTADFSVSLYRTWDEYEITTLFNSDDELCLVAEIEEELAGFALGTTVNKHNSAWKYGYLVWLGVKPGTQKGGVGDALFRELKRRMQQQGVRMILVDTSADNNGAIEFFRKQGFDKMEKHVYMSLNLAKKNKDQRRT